MPKFSAFFLLMTRHNRTLEVAATYLNVGGKLLFLELASCKSEAGAWGVPAGKIELDETPVQGAKRELLEETGIDISSENSFQLLGQLYISKPNMDYIYHAFAVYLDKISIIRLSSEHSSYTWVSMQETESLPLMNGAKQALDFYHRCCSKKTRSGANVNVYLILRKAENVLLHLRKNTGYCDNFYGLVSGHVEDGESATTAIIRETCEEAGVHLTRESLKIAHIMHRKTDRLNMDIFFECSDWEGDVRNAEPEKCSSLDYFSLSKLPSNTIDYIRDALKAIAKGIFYSETGWE